MRFRVKDLDFEVKGVWVRECEVNEEDHTKVGRYMGTSLRRNRIPLGSYSSTMPRALRWPQGGVLFLMSEVPLYTAGYDGIAGHNGGKLHNCPEPSSPFSL